MKDQVVVLRRRLKGFIKPDTNSQYEGYLEPGEYALLDSIMNSAGDTVYALVEAPELGGHDTWLCIRWQQNSYASIESRDIAPPMSPPLASGQRTVSDEMLLKELDNFIEYRYDKDNARYPAELPGVSLPMAPPKQNNCCTFVEALLVKVWSDNFSDFTWSPKQHHQMMIMSSDDYFSPITALVEAEMAVPVDDVDGMPSPYTVIQGWRKQWRGGHTFIILDYHDETDKVLTLESNSAYNLNGVGFRGINNLRDVDSIPPARWWERDDVWTWRKIRSTYRFRRHCMLYVNRVE